MFAFARCRPERPEAQTFESSSRLSTEVNVVADTISP